MTDETMTIRAAGPRDRQAIRRLAELEGAPLPREPALIALVDGQPLAALSLLDDRLVANPFERSAPAAKMLRARAAQLRPEGRRRGLVRLLRYVTPRPRSRAGLAGSPPGAGGRLVRLDSRG